MNGSGAGGGAGGAVESAIAWAGVPARLMVPPSGALPPAPVATKTHLLPLDALDWEDFERLCLRLLEAEVELLHVESYGARPVVRLYGSRGQAQEGIDVYARDAFNVEDPAEPVRYTCLQARRIRRVTKTALKRSVDEFIAGKWAGVSRRFIYATSFSGVATQLEDEVEDQVRRMKARGIEFAVWDQEELSRRLRQLPEIVDDFFGRPWVEEFCSAAAASALGQRLDGLQVRELRSALAAVYQATFAVADSGVLALRVEGQTFVGLRDRFVTPDIISTTQTSAVTPQPPSSLAPEMPDPADLLAEINPYQRPSRSSGQPASGQLSPLERDERVAADSWLARDLRQVVVGDAGTGKSTLLRYLTLDLLSPEPGWPDVAARWGQRLPVWLPFHFFTQRAADTTGEPASVSRTLKAWLEQHDVGHVWPLVQQALADERLLLIVDGLDEWVNDEAGRYAAASLETFTTQFACAVVVSTRPYGLSKLTLGTGWSFARVAPLSPDQQRQLALRYFQAAAASDGEHSPEVAERSADVFLREVWGSPDLRQVAGVPLFFVLLIGLRLSNLAQLPDRRFEVYDRAVQLLIAEHPARRRTAAAVTARSRRPAERQVRAVLAHAAFLSQVRGDFSAIERRQLRRDLVVAFRDPETLALDPPAAAEEADLLLDVAEGELGVLVRKGPDALGYLHRVLQEQLAAEHAAERLSPEEQQALVERHVGDPRWREVILALLWRTKRPAEVRALVEVIRANISETPSGLLAREVLAETAFGEYGLAPDAARTIAAQMLDVVDEHTYTPHRLRVLKHVVSGLEGVTVSDEVERLLRRSAVLTSKSTPHLVWTIAELGPDSDVSPRVAPLLLRALSDDDMEVAYASATAIAARAQRLQHVTERDHLRDGLLRILADPLSGVAQAAALCSLALGWRQEADVVGVLGEARSSSDPGVRLVALGDALGVLCEGVGQPASLDPEQAVRTAPLSQEERDWLLETLKNRHTANLHDGLLLAALTQIVGSEGPVVEDCLKRIAEKRGPGVDLMLQLALKVFPDEPRLVDLLTHEFRHQEYPWFLLGLSRGAASGIARAYPPGSRWNAAVASAIEDHLDRYGGHHRLIELNVLAQVDRGPRMKGALLEQLRSESWPHWAASALAENFLDDPEVDTELRSVLTGDATRASMVANSATKVLGNEASVERLREILRILGDGGGSAGRARFDIAVYALVTAWQAAPDTVSREQLAAEVIPLLPDEPDPLLGDPTYEIAVALYPAPEAAAALSRLAQVDGHHVSAFLRAYKDEPVLLQPFLDEAAAVVRHLSSYMRARVCEWMSGHRDTPALVMHLTRRWSDEVDDPNKSSASLAFHLALVEGRLLGTVNDDAWNEARGVLAQQAAIYGPDHESRRRAAWVGICVLGDWSIVDGLLERIGEPAPVGVSLSEPLHGPDMILVSQLVANWESLTAHFGEELIPRLSGLRSSSGDQSAWESLALAASQNKRLAQDLEVAVANDPQLLRSDSVLLWFATHRPVQSDALAEVLLSNLSADSNRRTAASYLLSRPETSGLDWSFVAPRLEQLVSDDERAWGDPALEALAYAQPDHQLVLARWQRYWSALSRGQSPQPSPHPQTYFAVAYAGVDNAHLLARLHRDIQWLADANNYLYNAAFVRHVTRRLSRDSAAAALVRGIVLDGRTSHQGAAQLLSLLSSAIVPDGELLAEIDRRLDLLRRDRLAPIMRDFVLGSTVSVQTGLLRVADLESHTTGSTG